MMNEKERLIKLLMSAPTDIMGNRGVGAIADYLLGHGVIVLPVKVGDTVYKLGWTTCKNGESYPDSYGCCGCEDECDIKRTIVEVKVPTREFIVGFLTDSVTSYYFTREEAEEALEEREFVDNSDKLKGVENNG